MASQRSRSARGPGRGNGGNQGEELDLWNASKSDIHKLVEMINSSSDDMRAIGAQDSYMAKNKGSYDPQAEEDKLEALFRGGVRDTENIKQKLDETMHKLIMVRAIQKSKEEAEAAAGGGSGPSTRERSGGSMSGTGRSGSVRGAGAKDREREREKEKERDKDKDKDKEKDKEKEKEKEKDKEKERDRDPSSLYDFDGGGDSPVPSPLGSHTRKLGGGAGSDRSGTRDSLPPRDSMPPDLPASAAATQRSKVNFVKGQDVVFKPKPTPTNDNPDWFLGRVQQVLGEGKSRRYKVQDADPDVAPEDRIEYRTSASSMIPIPAEGAELPGLDKGRIVLALYPDSTTFYKAEVTDMDATTGKVNLRFEGEENSGTLQVVDRRFVVEYRS
ncbi:SGF29 tudor-like domain-containing protein [Phialemonium atrogriseum]|uniref:SGF29 tudor-like domain-containing protein n=1 Tax=Phialemonium atrogriseum TaxID=1093897 RepID=A0AAJ0C867_9PEZI|nr:SGF29 tudor-like domain-containing protein [Phialemonium atrogriseum]KAK1770763.1 SGF29 tudor-like domain-containing protein [Phialemonium atrogriseum]